MDAEKIFIPVGSELISGLLIRPPAAKALYLFAHGAGAGMTHKAIESNAQGLASLGIATLRYQFPYMEKGLRRPDPPKVAHLTVRAAATKAAELAPDLTLFAGGRSFGGRMTSQAQAISPLAGVRGLAFLGFPLHPAGKPGVERAEHLSNVEIPMLFISGDRDSLADHDLLDGVVEKLGPNARLNSISNADHSFKVAAKSGRNSAEVEAEVLNTLANWIEEIAAMSGGSRQSSAASKPAVR